MKDVIAPFLALIRFPTMSLEEFLEVEESGLLEDTDIARILTYIVSASEKHKQNLRFRTDLRLSQNLCSGFGTNEPLTGFSLIGLLPSSHRPSPTISRGILFGSGFFNPDFDKAYREPVKFNPPYGTDTMIRGGVSQNINTRHHCITAMIEYKNKCLEVDKNYSKFP